MQLETRALKSLNITFDELRQVVSDNDKQRFSMIRASALADSSEAASPAVEKLESEALEPVPESDDPADYLIRANQGHSIKLDTEGLLTPITIEAGNVPETVVHGTDESAWRLILKSGGVRRMGRNHIHFASGLPAGFKTQDSSALPVISGMRSTSSVLIFIDIRKALESGLKFWRSANGVLLSEGNEKGLIPVEFFKRVEVRKAGQGVIMENGVSTSQSA